MTPEPSPDSTALIAGRRSALARQVRARLGFWRSLGRSNRLFPRKLVVTREGRWIIGIALLLGAGAVNTGNNLLYLVLSLVISVITVSGILSELCLRDLVLKRCYPAEVTVGQVTALRLEVHNDKDRAALHLEVGEIADTHDLELRMGYVLHLGPREVGQAFAGVRALRRGPISTTGLLVATAHPFGFARKARLHDTPAIFLSLPGVADIELAWRGAAVRGALDSNRRPGHGDTFRGLRDSRPGDSLRDIHWKVSARRERLIAREWEAEASRLAIVRFVHVSPTGSDDVRSLDSACATVAGLCALLLRQGLAVGLQTLAGGVTPGQEPAGQGDQLLRIRRHLAALTLADRRPPCDWPVPDDEWAALCLRADATARAIARGEPLPWGAMPRHGPAEVFLVSFASRADVVVAGTAHVEVRLEPAGEILGIDRASDRSTAGVA